MRQHMLSHDTAYSQSHKAKLANSVKLIQATTTSSNINTTINKQMIRLPIPMPSQLQNAAPLSQLQSTMMTFNVNQQQPQSQPQHNFTAPMTFFNVGQTNTNLNMSMNASTNMTAQNTIFLAAVPGADGKTQLVPISSLQQQPQMFTVSASNQWVILFAVDFIRYSFWH